MLPYQTDIDSSQKWVTKTAQGADIPIRYTFSTSYNISDFSVRLANSASTITGNGDSAKWTAAMNAVMDVAGITFSAASSLSVAKLGLLTANIADPKYGGFGWRNPDSGTDITSALSVIEAGQSQRIYIHELLHTLGFNHPGGNTSAGDNPAFNAYTVDSTIMRYGSYRDKYAIVGFNGGDVITPMAYDIALLQQKYGVHYYDAGDTGAGTTNRITFDGVLSQARTLWEGGAKGYDIIDASKAISASIDLRDGYNADGTPHFSKVNAVIKLSHLPFSECAILSIH